jgi:hypothetical protein
MSMDGAAPRFSARRGAPALMILCAVVAAAFGPKLTSLGFYNDDWGWLPHIVDPGSRTILGLAQAFWRSETGGFAARPAGLVYFPFLFRFFGLHCALYQTLYLGIDVAVAWNFYRLLVEEGAPRSQALLAGVFSALYPNHDATHHWMTDSAAPFALAGVLWAVRAFRGARRDGSCVRQCAAGVIYVFSALLYESSALLALLPAVLEFRDLLFRDRAVFVAARESILKNAAPISLLAGVVVFQRIIVPEFLGLEAHPMSLNPAHAAHVFQAGFECTFFNRLVDLMFRSSRYAVRSFGIVEWIIFACSALALAAWELSSRKLSESPGGLLPVLAITLFVLGYAPYVFDAKYTPSIFDPTNRVNMTSSLGGAAWWAWLAGRLGCSARQRVRRAGAVGTCLLLSGFLLADQVSGVQWAGAAETQRSIMSDIVPRLRPIPGPAAVLLFGAPDRVGSGSVFESTYDFNGALRLHSGRNDLLGEIGSGRIRFEKKEAVLNWYGSRPFSYERLYAYDASRRLLIRIADQRAGEEFMRDLHSP